MSRRLPFAFLCCALLVPALVGQAQDNRSKNAHPPVREIAIDGPIGPVTSSYVVDEIKAAATAKAPLIILRLDTPGGLDAAMRAIVKAILASPVPIAGFVGPSGARAASAGTYILYATHIATMAPATNLGAATPVNIGGGGGAAPDDGGQGKGGKTGDGNDSGQATGQEANKKSSGQDNEKQAPADSATAERRKVVNDAVAYIRSLAERRGRNADWAERAVRQGVSLSAQQALKKNVIDDIVANERALLAAVDGKTVTTAASKTTLATANAPIQQQQPDWRTQFLSVISNPTIAYLLFMVGIYGLILEGLNPGSTVPGVVGGISLLCALYAFQILPINYAGLGLIVLGIALMIAEMFAPSFGILGLGGVGAFVFGSIMLMDNSIPGFEISLGLIAGIAVAAALLLMFILYMFLRSRGEHVQTGREGLIGLQCVALQDFDGEGRVLLRGESWLASCRTPVTAEQKLVVVDVEGLKVHVRVDGPQPTTAYRG